VKRAAHVSELGETVDAGLLISNDHLRVIDPDLFKARRQVRQMLMDLREPKIIKGPTAKPANVRIATLKDGPAVHDLVVHDLEENARIAPISHRMIATLLRRCFDHQGGICGVIDGPDGKPIATQVLALEQWWWSEQCFLMKMFDYVHPDHRQSNHAHQLIAFAKWCSDYMSEQFGHRVYLLSGVLGTDRIKEKLRMYGRNLTQVGGTFLYPYPEPWDKRP